MFSLGNNDGTVIFARTIKLNDHLIKLVPFNTCVSREHGLCGQQQEQKSQTTGKPTGGPRTVGNLSVFFFIVFCHFYLNLIHVKFEANLLGSYLKSARININKFKKRIVNKLVTNPAQNDNLHVEVITNLLLLISFLLNQK